MTTDQPCFFIKEEEVFKHKTPEGNNGKGVKLAIFELELIPL